MQIINKKLGYFSFNIFPSHYAHSVQIMNMCQAFQRNGYNTTLFACRSDEELDLKNEDIFSHYGIVDRFFLQWVKGPAGKWRFRWRIFRMTLMVCRKFDVCYTRNFIAAFACHVIRKKCYFELHAPDFPKIGEVVMQILIRSKKICFITISRELAKIISRKYSVPIDKFMIEHDAYNPPDTRVVEDGFNAISYDFSSNQLKAMYIGSFYPGRGIEMIVRLAENNPDMSFIAIGGTAQQANISVNQNNLPNVFLFERIPHKYVNSLLTKADILLMPYANCVTIEGRGDTANFSSPLKLFEYLGAGKPIIASKLPSFCEILKNKENSLVVDPETFRSWNNALRQVVENNDLRARIKTGALKTAEAHTWDGRVKRIIDNFSI